MLKYTVEIERRVFTGATRNKAFKAAMKWYNEEICEKLNNEKLSISIIHDAKQLPQVTAILLVSLPTVLSNEEQCKICRENGTSLMPTLGIGGFNDCSRCSLRSAQKRAEQRMLTSREYFAEIIKRNEGEDDLCLFYSGL